MFFSDSRRRESGSKAVWRKQQARRRPTGGAIWTDVPAEIKHADLINAHVARVEVQSNQLLIELGDANAANSEGERKRRKVIAVGWSKTPSTRRREVLVPDINPTRDARPIRSESRALLIAAPKLFGRGRHSKGRQ